MDKENVLDELSRLIQESERIKSQEVYYSSEYGQHYINDDVYEAFRLKINTFLKRILKDKEDENIKKIKALNYGTLQDMQTIINILINTREYVDKEYMELDYEKEYKKNTNNVNILETIFSNFHKMARKIRDRYDDRETLDINDEYDVQDLLYATLQLFFEDIRKEEWTPSYAGNSSRVDFLLKKEKIVIEVKKTRASMKDKDLGEQLIIDIAKYKTHPDCKKLICFIYDPEGRIGNPTGMINDLERENENFVKVYINPKI